MLAFALSTTLQLVSFLPEGVVAAMAVATPALSAAAWLLTPRPSCFDALYGRAALRSLPLSVLGMFGAFLVAGRIAVGLLAYAPDSIFPFERLLSVGCAVAMVAVLFTMAGGAAKAGWGRTVRVAWAVLAIAFMAGMFLLFAGDDVLSHVGTGVLSAILGCFEMALFVILALAVYAARASGVFAFCAATLLFRLVPHAVGKGLAPVMMAADSSWTDQVVALAVPAMTFLLVAATIVFMNGRAMEDGWLGALSGGPEGVPAGDEGSAPAPRPPMSCQRVAAEAGLTPREADVLALMGEGRSYQRIADSLGISLGTVQGYVKAVYRKLGVHTRQEVIDLVSRR